MCDEVALSMDASGEVRDWQTAQMNTQQRSFHKATLCLHHHTPSLSAGWRRSYPELHVHMQIAESTSPRLSTSQKGRAQLYATLSSSLHFSECNSYDIIPQNGPTTLTRRNHRRPKCSGDACALVAKGDPGTGGPVRTGADRLHSAIAAMATSPVSGRPNSRACAEPQTCHLTHHHTRCELMHDVGQPHHLST